MVKYSNSNVTAKIGVNFLRSLIEENGSIFHKIEQENDLGIDGIIEFIQDGKPINKSIAVQIKSGDSYFIKSKQMCKIPIDQHRDYWSNYHLPVYGFVFIPALNKAFWINIKKYLDDNPYSKHIAFKINEINQLSNNTFLEIFIPIILNKTPNLPLVESINLFNSRDSMEYVIGRDSLFINHINKIEVWDNFINKLLGEAMRDKRLIYYLSHIPWHPDIWYTGERIKKPIKDYVLERIYNFELHDVVLLIDNIDDRGIERGTIGQSVDSVLFRVKDINDKLIQILRNSDLNVRIRNLSGFLLAFYMQEDSIPFLNDLEPDQSNFSLELITHLEEYGHFNPYI
ncbi:DUF4365 domain-containing protein [Leeuwenhoekiella sp. ZYFB001]|uniref:DUF4365 domain-containing protein n=1 Tax=Leeuwenhoekiella sp. ZYFB001 TaxID=2719912 RepID=UPI0014319767|nr:DUF4365 domain-containing protein [Leeuwenhoekiella sp. ZYFB001]